MNLKQLKDMNFHYSSDKSVVISMMDIIALCIKYLKDLISSHHLAPMFKT